MRVTGKLFVTLAVFIAALGSGRSAEPKPVGNWTRQCGPVRISLKFTENRLTAKAVVSATEEQKATTISLDADYSVNPEGIVYGLVTGIDADDPDLAADLQILAGHTFAARCRVDGDTLSIRDVKYLGIDATTEDADELTASVLLAAGRYQRDDGKRPAQPKKGRAAKAVQNLPIQRSVVVLPDGQTTERLGIDFNNLSQYVPVVPAVVPAASLPQPVAASVPAFNFPRPAGEWVRDIRLRGMPAPFRVSFEFAGDHLTLAITGTADGKPFSQTIDADYSITKDGLVFAVITSASVNIPMGLEGSDEERLANLADQLFSFRFRLDRGTLTIKDLRMPAPASKIIVTECRLLAGQYVPAADAPPMKARPTATTGMTPPSGRYLQHYPQYFPPDPAFPLQRELDEMNKRETAPMPRSVAADSHTTPERIHGKILP
jgi:hypothetical protein